MKVEQPNANLMCIPMHALQIQQPELLVVCAIQRCIHQHKDWKWVKAYGGFDQDASMCKSF